MKIMALLDSREYSRNILKEVARLAQNTLADIVFLMIQDGSAQEPKKQLISNLIKFRQDVCSYFDPEEMPYGEFPADDFTRTKQGDWILSSKGIKTFTLRISEGSIAKQAIKVAAEIDCDLVMMGCSGKLGCEWDGEMNVPLRVVKGAPCSVMVIKKPRNADMIVSILDQSTVSQESLELINQLVTLQDAGLKIVGVKPKKADSTHDKIDQKMIDLIGYYNECGINAWVRIMASADVKDYVTASSKEAIVALWLGKQSLLNKLFSSKVDQLLENTTSSLLILR